MTDFKSFVGILIGLVSQLTLVLSAVAIFVFFRGIFTFILKAGDVRSHEEGKNLMIWGIVALFVLVSLWGILRFLYHDFGFDSTGGAFGLPFFQHLNVKK